MYFGQIQKGILQLCQGLDFLHNSAKLVHTNLAPENILINAKVSFTCSFPFLPSLTVLYLTQGDWKIGGLGLTIPFLRPDGSPSKWEFPAYDSRIMPHVQRSFDYMGAYPPLLNHLYLMFQK